MTATWPTPRSGRCAAYPCRRTSPRGCSVSSARPAARNSRSRLTAHIAHRGSTTSVPLLRLSVRALPPCAHVLRIESKCTKRHTPCPAFTRMVSVPGSLSQSGNAHRSRPEPRWLPGIPRPARYRTSPNGRAVLSRHRSPGDRSSRATLQLAFEQAPSHGRAAHRLPQHSSGARNRLMAGAVAAGAVAATAPGVGLADSGTGGAAPAVGGQAVKEGASTSSVTSPSRALAVADAATAQPARSAQSGDLLQRGSTGPQVRDLQAVLNAWYPSMAPLTEDGVYGPETESTVRELQTRAGIAVDGIVGPQTRGVLGMTGTPTGGSVSESVAPDPAPDAAEQDTTEQDTTEQDTAEQEEPTATPGEIVQPAEGELTSGFGSRWGSSHNGIDIANEIGTPIRSTTDGVVVEAGPASGFGQWVRVQHPDGVTSVYGHINEALVSEGEQVSAGEQIATMGNRGQSTGPHLHFEIWEDGGEKIDPMSWLQQHGVAM
ncbi:MAG: peptidoglycan DD-metalloendopeptidase family protein [Pseudonocardiaceae bacterium]|nr:peptidoglycan DD-metalloendopeptidase family protein [Pseudonocardiaceae bacterium]